MNIHIAKKMRKKQKNRGKILKRKKKVNIFAVAMKKTAPFNKYKSGIFHLVTNHQNGVQRTKCILHVYIQRQTKRRVPPAIVSLHYTYFFSVLFLVYRTNVQNAQNKYKLRVDMT